MPLQFSTRSTLLLPSASINHLWLLTLGNVQCVLVASDNLFERSPDILPKDKSIGEDDATDKEEEEEERNRRPKQLQLRLISSFCALHP